MTRAFGSVNVQPLAEVAFNVSVGTVTPTSVTTLLACLGEVVRSLDGITEGRIVVENNRIAIVEPGSRRIATIIGRSSSNFRPSAGREAGDSPVFPSGPHRSAFEAAEAAVRSSGTGWPAGARVSGPRPQGPGA